MKNQTLGEHIKFLRKSRKLTQDELAKLTGLSRQMIIYIEKDNHRAYYSTLTKLSKALKVDVSDLLMYVKK